ncbi:Regulator of nucleoside diphosphate kinase [Caulifigura coniformis]|uniref:Regulator of nucleoside diphosphate kinase n=1 Tax=Caulifigura coniformis TaxID=2527983 RepID=A0A517S908_9PLAN|nr:GreA/GreB family elongation factor [Caulifigura coniformis]QDT52592.1 Regulator of nucleoside diphosphate kinase [Caulifigura coniformis]
MKRRPITLTIDDYARLRALVSSKVTSAFSDPTLLRDLYQELTRARLVELDEMPEEVITMNSRITLRDVQTGRVETYTLVYPQRADIANRRLSVLSPAGAAVLGHYRGDDIRWPIASGWRIVRVEQVEAGTAALAPSAVCPKE